MKWPKLLLRVMASGVCLLAVWLTFALGGQQQPAQKQSKKDGEGQPRDVVARVAKDLQMAEERLKKTDPGDLTRKIQRDVVDGLDELIKQNSKSESEGGAGASGKMKKSGAQKQDGSKTGDANDKGASQEKQQDPSKADKTDEQQTHGQAKGGKGEGTEAKNKDQGNDKGDAADNKEGAGKEGGQKKDSADNDKKGQAKGKDKDADKSDQGGVGIAKNDKSSKSKTDLSSELYRTDWGHLPLTKRLEMDAYSRERFMPRYDEMLQQYYRTVAEQGRGKDK
jgi:hypothetical protein